MRESTRMFRASEFPFLLMLFILCVLCDSVVCDVDDFKEGWEPSDVDDDGVVDDNSLDKLFVCDDMILLNETCLRRGN